MKTTILGTILVFVPGWSEIVQCLQLLRQRTLLASYLHILPLHSLLPLHNQQEIFASPPHSGLRKVILSTSIAETSITIDDVVYVVDTGLSKASDYDLETQGKCLLPANVSRANLLQRKGPIVAMDKLCLQLPSISRTRRSNETRRMLSSVHSLQRTTSLHRLSSGRDDHVAIG